MKRSNPLRLERLEDRTNPSSLTVSFVPDGTQVGVLHSELYQDNTGTDPVVWQQQMLGELQSVLSTVNQTNMTLSIVPDDGASMNAPAPQDGALRIAAVDQLFASDGTIVTPGANNDFMVGGGAGLTTFGIGLGLVGPNGQTLSPAPQAPGAQTSGSMLPLILPVQKAYGNLYPNPPTSPTPPTPPPPPPAPTSPAPTPPPSYSVPTGPMPTSPDATTPLTPSDPMVPPDPMGP